MKSITKMTLLALGAVTMSASAGLITGPQEIIYEGNILDNAGNPISGGDYDFRFSLWTNNNVNTGDINAGNINTGAPDYFAWTEDQTKTLSPQGYFSHELGKITPFPADTFETSPLYLQVEVKKNGTPLTSFELMDFDGNTTGEQRMPVASVPHAIESDKVDGHHVGTDPDDLAVLDSTGQFDPSLIPNETTQNTFTIDRDDLATSSIDLQFGTTLGNTLSFDIANDRFNFSNDVNIDGDVTTTGTINGVNIGLSTKPIILSPFFANGVFDADGSDNFGSMFELTDTVLGNTKNIIQWKTKQTSMQDYDLVIREVLDNDFISFDGATPIALEFQTDGSLTDAKIDFIVEKEGVPGDQIMGAGIDLSSNTWISQSFGLDPVTTWASGDVVVLKVKFHGTSTFNAQISDISLITVSK